jgi:hypothetical protein
MLPSGRPTRPDAQTWSHPPHLTHAPISRELKNKSRSPHARTSRVPLRSFPASPPPADLPPQVTSTRIEPRSVIPAAPLLHSLWFRLLPWCVHGDRAPAAGTARRGRGAPPPLHRHDSDLWAPRRRGPLSAGSPPFPPRARRWLCANRCRPPTSGAPCVWRAGEPPALSHPDLKANPNA